MNKMLKNEFIYQNKFKILDKLELQLTEYIYRYNYTRIHCPLGYISPMKCRGIIGLRVVEWITFKG